MPLLTTVARLLCLAVFCLLAAPSSALATTVWSGPMISFGKAAFADPTLAASQDRITDSVWITRATSAGLFNASTETLFLRSTSPTDTEWAWALAGFNVGLEIVATNYENLEFNTWVIAHGGQGGGPPSTVDIPGVLHLISEDIYIDITFTSWGMTSESGGSFSYVRSTVPEPNSALLLVIGLLGLSSMRSRSAVRKSLRDRGAIGL